MLRRPLALLALAVMATTLVAAEHETEHGGGDAVVIAVIDGSFSPYHWDFLGSKMPQHLDADPGNDLPLDRPANEWLTGFPEDPDAAFASFDRLDITLAADDANANVTTLRSGDSAGWAGLQQSTDEADRVYWVPDTKIVGLVDFAGLGANFAAGNGSHGGNTSSVAAGNLHGTCPECLVVLITYESCPSTTPLVYTPPLPGTCPEYEYALDWAISQPWIDVVTNSYGFSLVNRDRYYDGGNAAAQAEAAERGQQTFFSAGNGQANAFAVPNTTLLSSQEGPDWNITVGAVSPTNQSSYSGHGKPADIASIGGGYPSLGGSTVSGSDSTFGGTSNATPVVAGYYANALHVAREALAGASRTQGDGVIAVGDPVPCGDANPGCELGDGALTSRELRTRLFHGALHSTDGWNVAGFGNASGTAETEFLAEGHGSYLGRLQQGRFFEDELDRIVGPLLGTAAPLERPDGEEEWFVVDSYCRQLIWGSWSDGYYTDGETSLPDPDPLWPVRTAYQHGCPDALAPPYGS